MALSQYEKEKILALDGGMVSSVSTQMLDRSRGFSRMFKNLDPTLPGLPRKRPACVPVMETPGSVIGLHEFKKQTTGDRFPVIALEDGVMYHDGVQWTEVVGELPTAAGAEFLTIADKIAIAHGSSNLMLWDGSSEVVKDVGAHKASARTFLLYENNDLRFTAKTAGKAGNNIKVTYQYAESQTTNTTVSLTGSGTEEDPYIITVNLAWKPDKDEPDFKVVLSTAEDVVEAVKAAANVNKLVEVEHVEDSDGSHEVTEMPPISLTGGYDAVSGKYLTEYRLRAVIADGCQIHLSHTGDPTLWSPTATGSNAVSAYVSPDDGEEISGLLSMGDGGLLIGKPNSLYGLFGYKRENFIIEKLDPSVGVSSHRSMVYARPYGYFVGSGGVYRMQAGGIPERISYPIQEWFDENVDLTRLHESVAFRYERMYVVSLPGIDDNWVTLCYHIDQEKWSVWSNPQEVIDSAWFEEHGLCFITRQLDYIVALRAGVFVDYAGHAELAQTIDGEITTLELDAGMPEVEKDIGELYLVFRIERESYTVGIEVYADGQERPVVSSRDVEITGRAGRQKLVRVPLGKTLRFMEVVVKSDSAGPFTPMCLYYTFQSKDVL